MDNLLDLCVCSRLSVAKVTRSGRCCQATAVCAEHAVAACSPLLPLVAEREVDELWLRVVFVGAAGAALFERMQQLLLLLRLLIKPLLLHQVPWLSCRRSCDCLFLTLLLPQALLLLQNVRAANMRAQFSKTCALVTFCRGGKIRKKQSPWIAFSVCS